MCPEILRVPAAGRNLPVELGDSEVRSLVDIPSIFLRTEHGDGSLSRDTAFAASNGSHAAMNAQHFASVEGVRTLNGESATDRDLEMALEEWSTTAAEPVSKDQLPEDDLEALGYK
jgi:hypothetical protein